MRGYVVAIVGLWCVTLAACGGGGSMLTPRRVGGITATATPTATPSATSNVGPPASIANITPEPGLPSPVPLNTTLPAATAYPASTPNASTTALPTSLTLADLTSNPPDAAVTSALLDTLPAPAAEDTLVLGTISSFTSSAVVVWTQPFFTATGASPYPSVTPSPTLSLALSGATLDGVPGGFGSMRVGDAVLIATALGSAPSADYLTDLSVVAAHVTIASSPRNDADAVPPNVQTVERFGRSSPIGGQPAQSRRRGISAPLALTFGGETSSANAVNIYGNALAAPIVLPLATINAKWAVNGVLGVAYSFPLAIEDETGTNPWQIGQPNPLPVAIVNQPSSGSNDTTMFFYGDGLATFAATMTYTGPGATSKIAAVFAPYKIVPLGIKANVIMVPTLASPAPIPTSSPATYTADIAAASATLLNASGSIPLTLSLSVFGSLIGGPTYADFVTTGLTTTPGIQKFDVDTNTISATIGGNAGFILTPSTNPQTITLNQAPNQGYQGLASLEATVTVAGPNGTTAPQTVPFNPLAQTPGSASAYFAKNGGWGPANAPFSIQATVPVTCVTIANQSSTFNDGGGTSNCSTTPSTVAIADDISVNPPPNTTLTDMVKVQDLIETNGSLGPNSNGQVTINESDLPPASSTPSGHPKTCPSQGVTISPFSFTGASATLSITLPPSTECDFAVIDQNGAKLYYDITNSST